MHCQECSRKKATEFLHLRVNHEQHKIYLCDSCYQNGLSDPMSLEVVKRITKFISPIDELGKKLNHQNQNRYEEKNNAYNTKIQSLGRTTYVDEIATNLNKRAQEGKIDPVIGRDEEVSRVIEILNRRNKNNPILIGKPGVGKTAIAEALALKIEEKKSQKVEDSQVPSKLVGKQVYLLSVASLLNGTKFRGELEAKLERLIQDLLERKDVILFIDETHLLVGAGSSEGSPMDVGNFLKPYLARGELQVIGATTESEYRNIEKDPALERRFQPVIVDEPTIEEAIQILEGLQGRYEDFHSVTYTKETIEAAVVLSHRYIQDRFLPDKAIDLLDEAGSKVNLMQENDKEEAMFNMQIETIRLEKERAKRADNFELAAQLRDQEVQLLESKSSKKSTRSKVSVDLIQKIIEQKTGIPVQKMQQDEKGRMKNLDKNLAKKVIGQDKAVEKVAKAIRRSRAGLKSKTRPIGSFLFVGPTGVGKTELTKALAEELFGTKDSMIRLDMSEYMEKHSVSKLIGSPPGYVGYKDGGQLSEKVRRNPYSIILLDEIEKAHPDVQHMFLQILEDGRLTDSHGRTVSFKDTVIIMTSNAGVGEKRKSLGFGAKEAEQEINILESLGSHFKPEFLNRFDSIIEFNKLGEEELVKIVDVMLVELKENLADNGIELTLTPAAKRKLGKLGYSPSFGARPLRRVIQEQLEDRIAEFLLDNDNVTEIKVSIEKDEIVLEKN